MKASIKEKEVKLEDKYIRWFSDLSKKDVKIAGGKAANLGEMLKIGMPVPQGFVVIASAYEYFLETSKLQESKILDSSQNSKRILKSSDFDSHQKSEISEKTELKEKIYSMLNKIDVEDTAELEEIARKIRKMIEDASLPEDLEEEIIEAYDVLSLDRSYLENVSLDVLNILKFKEPVFVAVRSSATAEDSEKASFAGQQETFLNIKGKTALIEAIKKCFASLFTARSVYYRVKKGFRHEDVFIAVIVQVMVNSDKSGVIFSRDPVANEENIVIEAVFGLGEGVVSGKIQPDYFVVSRDLKILERKIADKKIAIVRNSSGKTETVRLTEERSKSQVLNDYEAKKLAGYALKLEEHYSLAQDIEFAISGGEIYIVQTRPITTLGKKIEKEEVEGRILLSGLAASPGIGSGEVKLILDLADLSKIRKGDVLVTKMTNPDMVVSMQKCSAIVTDEGGLTAHASIVSREMGIACVVGTKEATRILKDGMMVTVDGFNGKVYEGKVQELRAGKVEIKPIIKTKTKIKVMVDLPSFAKRAAETNCKEVGLLRLEGIIAESGKHPFHFLQNKKIDEYEEIIFSGISKIGKYFDELWIRTSDIRSDEFRHLQGAGKEIELNPMLGMHGIRAGLKYEEILKAELKAMKRLAEENKEKKIGIMMPQVISVDEVKETKKILDKLDIKNNIKLGVMIETPASVQIIEELCKEEIDFISFGTNDLTQYTLAIDRGNESVQYLYDEMNTAVLRQLAYVIRVCKKYGVETSICGQAGSRKDMVEFLVKEGIDSISVNADKAYEISEFVKELEAKGLRGEQSRENFQEHETSEVARSETINNKLEEEKIKEEKREERENEKIEQEKLEKEEKAEDKKIKTLIEEGIEEIGEEIKEKAEEVGKAVEEEWKNLVFGFDVFSNQEKESKEEVKKEEKETKEEGAGEEILDIF